MTKPIVSFLLFSLLITLKSETVMAMGCQLQWENIYFQDLVGEKERDPKTRKRKVVYKTFKFFQGHFPKRASINIPYEGNCDDVKFTEVTSFRNIGLRKFPGEEEEHHKHALFPKDLKFEKSPFETVKPVVSRNEKKKIFTLKTFKIYDALSTLDFKKYHPWQIRYEIFYRDATGTDNKASHVVDLKLTH